MADVDVETVLDKQQENFQVASFIHPSLQWLNNPTLWNVTDPTGEEEGSEGKCFITETGASLSIQPPAKKDFWSKTFYTPLLVKHDASALLGSVPLDREATIGVDFEYTAVTQFDQAGLLVYVDDEHWIKCGIEFCDCQSRLSVVVCNKCSDWSTQVWPSFGARLKVHKVLQSDSVLIEAAPLDSNDFHFVRIAHLSSSHRLTSSAVSDDTSNRGIWQIGPYAASPIAQKGCVAKFSNFFIGPKEQSSHSAEL
jgi:regulation of enolase protein 1 (concanavalin A-like superfamily)